MTNRGREGGREGGRERERDGGREPESERERERDMGYEIMPEQTLNYTLLVFICHPITTFNIINQLCV
jgi:hypothetical protein